MALEHFHINEQSYVAVITDFKMPDLNGKEFLKQKKDFERFVRMILMTGFEIGHKMFRIIPEGKL